MSYETFEFKIAPKPGWPCPACGGIGTHCDGALSIGPEFVRWRAATPCSICKGSGRVNVTPIESAAGGEGGE